MVAVDVALYFRCGYEDQLIDISSNSVVVLSGCMNSLMWFGVVDSYMRASKEHSVINQLNITFLSISRIFNVIGWIYVLYHFAFTRVNHNTHSVEPTLFNLLEKQVLDAHAFLGGTLCLSILFLASLFDPLTFRLLPWKRTEHTQRTSGYPCWRVVYGTLYFSLVLRIFQLLGTILNLFEEHSSNNNYISDLVFFI